MRINSAKDLDVYKKSCDLAMRIFQLSKQFPVEERFALRKQKSEVGGQRSAEGEIWVDHRSLTSDFCPLSRSVCLNLREAWAKRRYEAHFVSKLTDCDGENSETESSLDFAKDCTYITDSEHEQPTSINREVGRMLGSMINHPSPFLISDL